MLNYFNFKHCARAFGGDVRLVVGTVTSLNRPAMRHNYVPNSKKKTLTAEKTPKS